MALTLRSSQKYLGHNPTQVQDWLKGLEKESQELNRRLREITQGLHPSVLADLGLVSALRSYMDSLARQPLPTSAPSCVTLTTEGFDGDRITDPKLERDLYYVTRQALDNAIAHAQAEQVFIHLGWRDQMISITVQDTGQGMSDAPEALMGLQGHLGLLSMNERVQAWQGQLTFNTERHKGTSVHIRVPIDQASRVPTHLQAFNHYLRLATVAERSVAKP
jgi:two-component system sensor histidine kinase DegS